MEFKKDILRQSGTPVEDDRCTVVITGHYQEYDADTTYTRYAFDRILPPSAKPYQKSHRINPGTRIPVPLGDNTPGKCELLLGHDTVKLSRGTPGADLLAQSQESNIIKISNEAGDVVALLYPNRACMVHFAGPVFAESTTATALLNVTVFPA